MGGGGWFLSFVVCIHCPKWKFLEWLGSVQGTDWDNPCAALYNHPSHPFIHPQKLSSLGSPYTVNNEIAYIKILLLLCTDKSFLLTGTHTEYFHKTIVLQTLGLSLPAFLCGPSILHHNHNNNNNLTKFFNNTLS